MEGSGTAHDHDPASRSFGPVSQATMVALDVLHAEGLWRDFDGDLEMVFAVHDLQPVG